MLFSNYLVAAEFFVLGTLLEILNFLPLLDVFALWFTLPSNTRYVLNMISTLSNFVNGILKFVLTTLWATGSYKF